MDSFPEMLDGTDSKGEEENEISFEQMATLPMARIIHILACSRNFGKSIPVRDSRMTRLEQVEESILIQVKPRKSNEELNRYGQSKTLIIYKHRQPWWRQAKGAQHQKGTVKS